MDALWIHLIHITVSHLSPPQVERTVIKILKAGVNISVNNAFAQHPKIMEGQLQSKLKDVNHIGNPARELFESTSSCKILIWLILNLQWFEQQITKS